MVTLSHGELLLPAAAFCFHICTLPLIWSCGIEADDAAARTQDCKRPFADRRRAVQRRPNGPRPAVCPAEPVCRAMPERQRQALPSAKPPCGPRCRHIQTAHGRLTGRRIGTRRLPAPILFALAARLSLSGQICTAGCRDGRLCPRDISGWHRSAIDAVRPQLCLRRHTFSGLSEKVCKKRRWRTIYGAYAQILFSALFGRRTAIFLIAYGSDKCTTRSRG